MIRLGIRFRTPLRRLLGLLACAALLFAASAQAKERVNVSLFSWPGYGFWFIVKDQNLAPNIDLNIAIIEDPYESFALMTAGRLDVTSSTVEYGPLAAETDAGVRLVSYTNPSYGTDKIILGPGIESAQDLVGKRVAVLEGGLTQIFMGIWLEENGVKFDQVEYVNLVMDDAVGALVSGSVAAAEYWEPFGSHALELVRGSRVVATSSEDYWIDTALLGDGMYMSTAFIEQRPEVAAEIMAAYFRAVDFWKENPAKANRIIARGLGFAQVDVEMVIGNTGQTHEGGVHVFSRDEAARFMGLAAGEPPLGLRNGQIRAHWELTSEWWQRFGLIETRREPEAGIAFSVMQTMLERN